MKKIALAILFTAAATCTFAQTAQQKPASQATQAPAKTLEQRAEAITASMAKNLRLTPDQVKKVQAINLESMRNAEKVQKKYKADPKQVVQQMDIISQTRLSRIKDVLTQPQFEQYQQRREEKMGVPREVQSSPSARQGAAALQDQN
ncbi:hypothetical protein [Pontibacter vulgaris]|uniref:hypothetical protein n=1 Tax=Pontibacter vulgaris TaxID=2905679 RepID=UPI001FA7CE4D|nr:hypothetical protein [Pontibacter vulgaris]